MDLTTCLVVALGVAIGTFGRYALALALEPISRGLPWGTVAINVGGSSVIGFFGTLTQAHGRYPVPESARLFVMVGLCDGSTTFSSFSLQTLDLLRAGAVGRASVNVGVSVVLRVCTAALGHALASLFNGAAAQVA